MTRSFGSLPRCYSPSQIETFLRCERIWGWQYLEDDVERLEATAAQALGTDTHKQLEEYVGLGNSLDYTRPSGLIAEPALEYIHQWIPFTPCPKPEFATEREFIILSPKHRYYGLIDLSSVTHGWIADYKTTSNTKYIKTEEELHGNVQAIIYATNLLIDRPDLDQVQLRWLYLTTKGAKKCIPRIVDISRDEVATMFAAVEGIADIMDSHLGKRALELQPNPRQCEAFGGCPHRSLCNLSPKEKLRSLMSKDDKADGLLAQLTKKQNEIVATSGVNPPEAARAPSPEQGLVAELARTEPKPDHGAALARTLADGEGDVVPPNTVLMKTLEKEMDSLETTVKKTKASAPKRPIGTLYVDCMPMATKDKLFHFADLLMQAREIITATEFKGQKGPYRVSDYRLMEFGQGPAVLLASVDQVLSAGRLESLFVQANTPEASICLAYLQSVSDKIVLGTR